VPPLPVVPNVIKTTLKGTTGSNAIVNRFYMRYTGGPPSPTDMAAWTTAVGTGLTTTIAPILTSATVYTEIDAIDLSSASGASSVATGSWTSSGGATGLNGAMAFHIIFHILRRYRGGKPGIYAPPLPATSTSNPENWTTGAVGIVFPAWRTFLTTLGATTAGAVSINAHVSVSYYQGFTPVTYPSGRVKNVPKLRTGGPLVDVVTGYSCPTVVAFQTRRVRP
jgi:hypothetical protein